jgi:hypothetical protein
MTELETRFCGATLLHGWHHWYREGDGIKEEDPVMVRCDGLEKKLCPDSGVCHHMCGTEGYPDKCFRVRFAGPLSGVFPDNKWPKALREEHGAWQTFDSMVEVVEERIFDSIAEETDKPMSEVVPCGHAESRNNAWMCLDCVAEVGMKTTLRLVLDRIEAMAVETEAEADEAGRDNPTLRTIKLIRAQGMHDVITALEKELSHGE